MKFVRTDSSSKDFIELVKQLDAYLAEKDGNLHSFYNQYNNIDSLNHVIVAYEDDIAIACGAIKEFADGAMEVKRMYTLPQHRGKGIATKVLKELERWAAESGNNKCILETGKCQTEAIALYTKNGYGIIPNYGQYAGVDNSVCFEKQITQSHSQLAQ